MDTLGRWLSRRRRLASGLHAEIRPDRFVPGAFELVVDGTPQSHVNLDDPTDLFFEYIVRMGHVIDQLGMPGSRSPRCTWVRGRSRSRGTSRRRGRGRGSRCSNSSRGSSTWCGAELPLPRGASIRVRYGDARETLGKLPAGLRGSADLVVVDIFGGARIPAHVTSREFYTLAATYLAPDGRDAGQRRRRRRAARSRAGRSRRSRDVLADVALLAEPQVLRGPAVRQLRDRRVGARRSPSSGCRG